MMSVRDAHVCVCGLTQEQRMRIFTCARAVRLAKSDKRKRRKALEDFRKCLAYFERMQILTPEQATGIFYAFNGGI